MSGVTVKGRLWDVNVKTAQSGMLILDTSISIYTGKDKATGKGKYMSMAVKAFGDVAADAADSLNKGDNAVIMGTLSQETWDDKTTGKKQYKTVLIADTIAKDTRRFKSAPVDTPADASQFGQDVHPDDCLPF